MSPPILPRSPAERLYRALLRAYPAAFRREYGPDMLQLFRDRHRDVWEGRSSHSRTALWLSVLCDWSLTVPREHWATLRSRHAAARSLESNLPQREPESMLATLQDLKYALRTWRKNPGFAFVVVLTLAIAIGANTAIFSVLNAVLLRPLPYRDPGRLMMVWEHKRMPEARTNFVNPANYLDWKKRSRVFQDLGIYTWASATLIGGAGPEEVTGKAVSPDLFTVLGVPPLLGRGFLPEESEPGRPTVFILSHRLWTRRFGGDSSVIGKVLELATGRATVVGVIPRDFRPLETEEYWEPFTFGPNALARRGRYAFVIGRLHPGVSVASAHASMVALGRELEREYPDFNTGWSINAIPLTEQVVGRARSVLLLLSGAVVLVFLIACANIGNLFLGRAIGRQEEFSVRTALGASALRLARQRLVESLVLSLVGGTLGLSLALLGVRALVATGLDQIPRLTEVRVDFWVLGFNFGAAIVAGLLFAALPGFSGIRTNIANGLRPQGNRSTAGRGTHRARSMLVVAQVALSLILLVGAGLMIRSIRSLSGVDPGFDSDHVLTLRLTLPSPQYPRGPAQPRFFDQLADRLRALPGVRSVGMVSFLPLAGIAPSTSFSAASLPVARPGEKPAAEIRDVDPGYFQTLRIPLLRGRSLTPEDGPNSPGVVVVSQTLARAIWGMADPIGERIQVDWENPDSLVQVVGVVGDVLNGGLDGSARAMIYYAHRQMPFDLMTLVVRSKGEPEALIGSVRAQVAAMDKNLPIHSLVPMRELLTASMSGRRYPMFLLSLLSTVALILAAVGIYGVLGYLVTQRTKEIGLRVALGASGIDVLRSVVGRGLGLVLLGLALGIGGALVATRALGNLLYGVTSTDPMTFLGVSALLMLVAAIASYLPARRATRVDPMVALRSD